MVATFDPSLGDDISQVRQRIGDTDTSKAMVQDETISAYRGQGKTILRTAWQLAKDLAAKYSRLGDVTVDDQRNVYSSIAKQFRALAVDLGVDAEKEESTSSAGNAGFGPVIVTGIDDCRGPLAPRCCDLPSWLT